VLQSQGLSSSSANGTALPYQTTTKPPRKSNLHPTTLVSCIALILRPLGKYISPCSQQAIVLADVTFYTAFAAT
jgi:hypothetical protein